MQDFFHQQYHSCLGRNDNASYCSWWQLQRGNRKPKMYHKRWRVITAMVKVLSNPHCTKTTSTLSPCKVYYLPAQGCLSIGRRADCEVCILGSFSKHLGGMDAHHEQHIFMFFCFWVHFVYFSLCRSSKISAKHQWCEWWLHHIDLRSWSRGPSSVVEAWVECPPCGGFAQHHFLGLKMMVSSTCLCDVKGIFLANPAFFVPILVGFSCDFYFFYVKRSQLQQQTWNFCCKGEEPITSDIKITKKLANANHFGASSNGIWFSCLPSMPCCGCVFQIL